MKEENLKKNKINKEAAKEEEKPQNQTAQKPESKNPEEKKLDQERQLNQSRDSGQDIYKASRKEPAIVKQEESKEKKKKKKKEKRLLQITIGINEHRDLFIENLAMLLNSGMSISKALTALEKDSRSPRMKKVIGFIKDQVVQGLTLWSALEKTQIFSAYVISLIKMGELSGHLSRNLAVVSTQKKKERAFNSKIQTAMMYPMFVLTLTLIIGIGVAWFVLPRLASVFDQLKVELPLITKIVIGFGKFIRDYGNIAVPLFVALLVFLGLLFFIIPKTKFLGQIITFNIPGIKLLIKETELSRMGYLLGTLLEAGIPIVTSLKSLSTTTAMHQYKNFYKYLADNIAQGSSFSNSFKAYEKSEKLIPIPIQQMIIASEKSGKLSQVMLEIGEIYETKNEDSTKRLSTMLEPIMLFIVWVGVMFVALAIIMPIYSLVGGFQRNPNVQSSESAPSANTELSSIQQENTQEESDTNENENTNPDPNPNQDLNNTDKEQEKTIKRLEMTRELEVNIREEPNTDSPILGKTVPGQTYEYLEIQEIDDEIWYKIIVPELENNDVWVYGEYVINDNEEE